MKNKIRRAETFGLKYEVRGVPAFVVNGKYKVSASRDVGTNELLDVVDYLINLERK
jgi:predicted DsbA family dithiol-disulfide isomerase